MKIDAVKWGGVLLVGLALMAGSAWAAWAWQVNANAMLVLAEQGKRVALEQWQPATNPITEL